MSERKDLIETLVEMLWDPVLCGCVCPLGGEFGIGCGFGLYARWVNACTCQRRSQIASEIASLPWTDVRDKMGRSG